MERIFTFNRYVYCTSVGLMTVSQRNFTICKHKITVFYSRKAPKNIRKFPTCWLKWRLYEFKHTYSFLKRFLWASFKIWSGTQMSWAFSALLSHAQHTHTQFVSLLKICRRPSLLKHKPPWAVWALSRLPAPSILLISALCWIPDLPSGFCTDPH